MINAWSPTTGANAGKIVRIYREDGVKKSDIVEHDWYFFTDRSPEAKKVLDYFSDLGFPIRYVVGNKYIKIFFNKKKFKDGRLAKILEHLENKGIQHYEADLGPMKRFFIDHPADWVDYEDLDIMFFDIETDDSEGEIEYRYVNGSDFKRLNAKHRILSIAAVDKYGGENYFTDPDEKKILQRFDKFLKDSKADMLVGYNSTDFDLPYILQRMRKHDLDSGFIYNILHIDLYRRIQDFYRMDPTVRQSLKSYSLNSVSDYFLKETKVPFVGKVKDLYDKDPDKLREYNIKDCHLVRRLEETLGIVERTHRVMSKCGVATSNWSSVKVLDNLMLMFGNKKGDHFITNPPYLKRIEKENLEYMGGFVMDPKPGAYENVYVFDFNSLYPNIMRTFNISPDSYVGSGNKKGYVNAPGSIDPKIGELRGSARFRKEPGAFAEAIGWLLDERASIRKKQKDLDKDSDEWRDLNVQQLVVKEVANSIYGVLGNQFFRGFSINLVESVTGVGQFLIKHLRDEFEAKGRTVVYGDTDSIFFTLGAGETPEGVLEETNSYLKEYIPKTFNTNTCTIELGIDKHFTKFLIPLKKTYCGILDGKIKYTGFELIKRDTIGLARKLQTELIDTILHKDPTVNDLKKWMEKNRKRVETMDIDPDDITVYKSLGKDAKLYKGKSFHVDIAKRLKVDPVSGDPLTQKGAIIGCIAKEKNPGLEWIHVSEFDGTWDRQHYWDNLIYNKLAKILDVLHPEVDWEQYLIKPIKRRKKVEISEEADNNE